MKYFGKGSVSYWLYLFFSAGIGMFIGAITVGAGFAVYKLINNEAVTTKFTLNYYGLAITARESGSRPDMPAIFLFFNIMIVLFILLKLRALFKSFYNEIIFSEDNMKLIKKIGLAVAVMSITIPTMMTFMIMHYLKGLQFSAGTISLTYSIFDFNIFISGIIIFIIGEIFRHGVELQKEVELTI